MPLPPCSRFKFILHSHCRVAQVDTFMVAAVIKKCGKANKILPAHTAARFSCINRKNK